MQMIYRRIAPAVLLTVFFLCARTDRAPDDFNRAFAVYQPSHVAGTDDHR
jgi:hypothetical protein